MPDVATRTRDTELRHPLRCPVEEEGVGTLDEEVRTSTPWTFFGTFCGTGPNLGTLVFGWIPIALGLGFWPAVTSMSAGVLVAALIPMPPLLVVSTRTATNNATSSGAEFGVHGRLIGSGLGLLLVVLGITIAVWSAGQILVAAAARLLHTPTGTGALAVAYVILTVAGAAIGVWGYHLVVRANVALAIFGTVAVGLMLAAFAGHLHPGYPGSGHYAFGTFTKTWLLSALAVGVGGVMTMGTLTGDWSRYVSARRYPPARFLPPAILAVVLAYIVPMSIGALVATALPGGAGALFPQTLAAAAPAWYAAALLVPLALLGNLGWIGASIYSVGLDLQSVIPRRRRPALTVAMSGVSLGLVLAGSIAWNAANALSTASAVLLAASAPWAAVIGVGWLLRRGRYDQHALQAFNLRTHRGVATRLAAGPYWYRGGWNPVAVAAWAAGCAWGALTVQTTLYTGPAARIGGGPDVSFAGAFTIAAVLYLAAELAARRRATQLAAPAETARA